jgi:Na+-transporting NADH:ubiquinone oxidoreductase subunit C
VSANGNARVLAVAGAVALICAGVVTSAHVLLRPRIEANILVEQRARMAAMLQRISGLGELLADSTAATLEARVVDLATGETSTTDPERFDPVEAAQDLERGRALAPEADVAGLGRVAKKGVVYLVHGRTGRLELVILPFRARGYQSVIGGFIALEPDLHTVAALNVVDQRETPGLGARVQSPQWQAAWPGRSVVDAEGALSITVVRGRGSAAYEVDGITGATRSSQAVGNAVRFWLGPDGYGPFLDRLRGKEDKA